MLSISYSRSARPLATAALLCSLASLAWAQHPTLAVKAPNLLVVKKGGTATAKLTASLNEGFHANSHTPSEPNLIPLTLTWQPGPLEAVNTVYPTPQLEKYAFSPKPISVVTGEFVLATKFKVAANAEPGAATMVGKLRYQACNNESCFPPKTVEVKLPVTIR